MEKLGKGGKHNTSDSHNPQMMCVEGSPHSAGGLLACCKQEEAGAPTVIVVLLADDKRSSQWTRQCDKRVYPPLPSRDHQWSDVDPVMHRAWIVRVAGGELPSARVSGPPLQPGLPPASRRPSSLAACCHLHASHHGHGGPLCSPLQACQESWGFLLGPLLQVRAPGALATGHPGQNHRRPGRRGYAAAGEHLPSACLFATYGEDAPACSEPCTLARCALNNLAVITEFTAG